MKKVLSQAGSSNFREILDDVTPNLQQAVDRCTQIDFASVPNTPITELAVGIADDSPCNAVHVLARPIAEERRIQEALQENKLLSFYALGGDQGAVDASAPPLDATLSRTRAAVESMLGDVSAVDSELFSLLQGALNRVSMLENNPN